jgi:peptidoglycan/LPS O-acetylase OafA/YrhL
MALNQPRQRLDSLTSLRFFAAALVFFNHFARDALAQVHAPQPIQQLFQHGREAVIFFFLLSGFVLSYSYSDGVRPNGMRVSAWEFWWARFTRIYPSYLLALALPLPRKLAGAVMGTVPVSQLYDLPWVILLLQAWIPSKADAWNPPAWSLSVEAVFYAFFPIGAMMLLRLQTRFLYLTTLIVLAATAFLQQSIAPYSPNMAAFFPLIHLPVFCLGMVFGREFLCGHLRLRKSLFFFWFASFCVVAELMFSSNLPDVLYNPFILALLYGLLILAAAQLSGVFNNILSSKLLVLLGEASYVLYILHMPFTVAMQRLVFAFIGDPPLVKSLTFIIFLFAINVMVSVIVHLRFEMPVRKWLYSHIRSTGRPVVKAG